MQVLSPCSPNLVTIRPQQEISSVVGETQGCHLLMSVPACFKILQSASVSGQKAASQPQADPRKMVGLSESDLQRQCCFLFLIEVSL